MYVNYHKRHVCCETDSDSVYAMNMNMAGRERVGGCGEEQADCAAGAALDTCTHQYREHEDWCLLVVASTLRFENNRIVGGSQDVGAGLVWGCCRHVLVVLRTCTHVVCGHVHSVSQTGTCVCCGHVHMCCRQKIPLLCNPGSLHAFLNLDE